LADSLVVFDYWARRVTVLTPAGDVARTTTFAAPTTQELNPLADGRFVLSLNSLGVMEASSGRTRIPTPLVLVSDDGIEEDTIVVVPGFEEWVFERGSGQPPLGRTSSIAVSGNTLVTATGEGVLYRVWNLNGTLERIVRVSDYPLEAPEEVRDSIRADLLTTVPGQPDWLIGIRRDMADDIPIEFAGITDLLIDESGNVWTAEHHARGLSGEARGWLVFGPSGEWFGRLTMPADFDAYEVGDDYVLGRKRDALGVETIQLLRLVKP